MTIRGSFAVTLLVTLSVSLAADLMIAGLLISRFAGPRPGGDEINWIVSLGIRDFPAEIQRGILDQARVRQGELNDDIDAIRAAEQRMFQAMRADPFDRVALDAAFADVLSRRGPVSS
jgi:hypothetical protein